MDKQEKRDSYDLPKFLNFNLTWKCNIRCRMCNNWALDRGDREELSALQILETVNAYKSHFDILRVRFWGGEPFLRDDLIDIVKNIPSPIETLVITNGTLISESNASEIVDSGLDFVEFSIDLPEQHNDFLRGKGTYERAMSGLKILQKEKKRQGSEKPKITLRPLITRLNYLLFEDLFQWARNNGIDFGFVFLRDHFRALEDTFLEEKHIGYYQPGLRGEGQNKTIAEMVLPAKECRKIWDKFSALERNFKSTWFSDKMRAFLLNVDHIANSLIYSDCARSRTNILVDPCGDLYPCEFLTYKYGNCLTDGPMSWFSEQRNKVREEIIEGSLPICRECNRYGLKRPLFSSYNYISRYYGHLTGKGDLLPDFRSVRWRIRIGK